MSMECSPDIGNSLQRRIDDQRTIDKRSETYPVHIGYIAVRRNSACNGIGRVDRRLETDP